MFCHNCKSEIIVNSQNCPNCGYSIMTVDSENQANTQSQYSSNTNNNEAFKNLPYQISSIKSDMMFGLLGHIGAFFLPIVVVIGIIYTLKTPQRVIELFNKLNIDASSVNNFAKGYKTFWYSFLGLVILSSFSIVYIYATATEEPSESLLMILFGIIGAGLAACLCVLIWGLVVWIKTNSQLNELLNSDICKNIQSNQTANVQVSAQNVTASNIKSIENAKNLLVVALILNALTCLTSSVLFWIIGLIVTIISVIKVKRIYDENNQNFNSIKLYFSIYFIYELLVVLTSIFVYISYLNTDRTLGVIKYFLNYIQGYPMGVLIGIVVFSIVHLWGYMLWKKTRKILDTLKK